MPTYDIDVYQRTNFPVEFILTDSTGAAVDITNYTVYFYAKEQYTDTDANAKIAKTVAPGGHSAPTSGTTIVTLTKTDTNQQVGDLFYTLSGVDGSSLPYVFFTGMLRIHWSAKDIT